MLNRPPLFLCYSTEIINMYCDLAHCNTVKSITMHMHDGKPFMRIISLIKLFSLSSSSNQKYWPFPLLSYFSVVVCLRCLLHHILSRIAYTFREELRFRSHHYCAVLWWVQIVGYVMACRSFSFVGTPSHYYHCVNLSVDIELMKCLSDIFCRVCE